MPNRRHFLQLAGVGAAAAFSARRGVAADAATTQTATARKAPLSLGIASYSLRDFPRDKVWSTARTLGVKHICLHPLFHLLMKDPLEKVAAVAAEAKKQGCDLYGGGVAYVNNVAAVDKAFEWAKAAGLRVIVGAPAPALLPHINEQVQKYDIQFAIHNHGPEDGTFPTPGSAYEKIKGLDRRVGVCIDVGHTLRAGVDPCEAVQLCADRLLDMHIKDINAADRKGHAVLMGRGVIDIPRFVRTLIKVGYQGITSFEYEAPGDALLGLSLSVGYVQGVMATI